MSCLFNSYDPYFKQPFGAVRAGQTVHLSLCIPEELGYVDPHLVIQKEGKYDVPVYYRMKFDGQTPKQNHFSVDVTLGDVGLYFYYFDLYTDFRRIFRGPDNCGVVSWQEGESWQLTVYEPSFQTPDSIKGKVFYQIFPDRFCEGVENKPLYAQYSSPMEDECDIPEATLRHILENKELKWWGVSLLHEE